MERAVLALLCAALLLALCGCGMFQEEYVVVGDYVPAEAPSRSEERITVTRLSELREALLEMVSAGETERSIAFDAGYAGEISEDIASACWQVRTQDALCAYCVENISYDLKKIVNYMEAHFSIRYSEAVCVPTEVLRRPYSSGIDELLREMIAAGERNRVVLIDRSTYSAEGMEELVSTVYRADPILAPREPEAAVMMLSGSGMQRLYEINLDYGMDDAERRARLEALASLAPFEGLELEELDEAHRALAAAETLAAGCVYDPQGANDLYSALIGGSADDEGMAFAYVRLCALLGVSAQVVYGQRNWKDYSWNIVSVDGSFYHVDPALCAAGDYENGFLLRDERMWEDCRWDVSAYPPCTGDLSWHALAVMDGLIEEDAPEAQDEEENAPDAQDEEENAPDAAVEQDGNENSTDF